MERQSRAFESGAILEIADLARVGWTRGRKRAEREISQCPRPRRWLDTLLKGAAAAEASGSTIRTGASDGEACMALGS
jgi:hypothetical protein